ncbi:YdbL family protein [Mariprofundus sp. EBB-1]|uniref:YdbL family protein n=1 Tax=Mariprofundus sp. EBB-1 TaxID=2650971 RepID=UPI001F305500|nr:YdbL family protein [Mariprofundus sp. EBB-1]
MQIKQNLFRFMAVLAVSLTMIVAGASSAWSADIRSAKAAGQIGEQLNGYLGVVSSAPADVRAMVQDINQKRRAVYQRIASKNGTSLQAVEQMAAKKAINKTPPGQYIQSSGGWVKK